MACFLFLADRPKQAAWLDPEEKRALAQSLLTSTDRATGAGPTQLRDLLCDPMLYKLAFSYFAFYCVESALLVWIPTLLKNVGVTTISGIGWVSSGSLFWLPPSC